MRAALHFLLVWAAGLSCAGPALAQYQLFEAGQVRPLALSPDGTKLLAVNTPDDHLEIFDVDGGGQLTRAGSVRVGLRPVAVAARTDDEVWVVNHVSDSVSIVKLTPTPRVVRTLLVGDEPGDLVFAGPGDRWAFVTTAHRGQHSPNGGRINRTAPDAPDQSQFTTPSVGRADVWVFDTTDLGSELGGTPVDTDTGTAGTQLISLFGDKPRALAVSPDGSRVYAAVFHSGNQTTAIIEGLVCGEPDGDGRTTQTGGSATPSCSVNGVTVPGGYPPPHENDDGIARPETGFIVKLNRPGGPADTWSDELDRDWNDVVNFDLPDRDVFEIDANADPPVPLAAGATDGDTACADGAGCWSHVGTVLFDMAVNPISGKIYVSNTDAQNHVRFEGPGTYATGKKPPGEPTTVQGNLARSRITVLDGASVAARHLNKHLDYSVRPADPSDRAKSLATPLGMAVSADGSTLYLAAFGSSKIGVYDTGALESGSFDPDETNPASVDFVEHIQLGGGGPTGFALGPSRLYVLTRFDNTLRAIDTSSHVQTQALALHNPETQEILEGRPFLYDAMVTSSNGEASCSSCHVFGDLDSLGWDLGDPDGSVVSNTNPFNPVVPPIGDTIPHEFHPMKGPMATQSLRGLDNMGPEHWRGDRRGDEVAAFEAFNVAFPGLVGRAAQLSSADMTKFRKFALLLRYPPNPIRKLDNSLRTQEGAGMMLYNGRNTDTVTNCNGCHVLDAASGHFGGDGRTVFDGEPQHMKIPHLRNGYQKVGMFGMSEPLAGLIELTGDFSHQGAQVRGFGFLHDGSIDSLGRFLGLNGFDMNSTEEAEMEAFVMAFPTDLAPIVGQQVTLHAGNFSVSDVEDQIGRLIARAGTGFVSEVLGSGVRECDLVARLVEGGTPRGYLYDPDAGLFLPDDDGTGIDDASLRDKALIGGQEVTYSCTPPGSGQRTGLDRDEDALLNGVETGTGVFVSAADTGSDPARADTDGDGFDDGAEVLFGSDPNDPLDSPAAQLPALSPAGLGLLLLLLAWLGGGALRRRR